MQIRTANLSDAATIARFNAAMALESENVKLDPDVLTAGSAGVDRPRCPIPAELSTCSRNRTGFPPAN